MNLTVKTYINAITQHGELRVKSIQNKDGCKCVTLIDRSGGKWERNFKI